VRNDGRGTPIATLLAHAPDAIRGDGSATAVLMREAYGWPLQNRCLDLGHLGYGMVAVSIVIRPGVAIVWKKRIQPKERT
jgi:hypothetical protein